MFNISTRPNKKINDEQNTYKKYSRYEPASFIKSLSSNMVSGEKAKRPDKDGKYPVYPIQGDKDTICQTYNRQRWVKGHTNTHYRQHANNERTIYYQGNGDGDTLVMIDIDVQKSKGLGSKIGADNFAQYLQTIWPDLYVEDSTNGKGVHGYFILQKQFDNRISRETIETVNDHTYRLEAVLKKLAVGFDIEDVEVKGQCPVIEKDRHKQITFFKFGYFAKVPRHLNTRFEELKQTTRLTLGEIVALEQRFADVPSASELPTRGSSVRLGCGSSSGKIVSEQMLNQLPEIERQLFAGVELKAGRWTVTNEDLAIAWLVLWVCTMNRNADGSMPTARVKALWDSLYACGDVKRPFNTHRWTVIRNYISDKNMFNWESNEYYEGQAMKFGLSEEVMGWLVVDKREERASFDVTITEPNTLIIRPKRKFPFGQHPAYRLERFILKSYERLDDWAYRLAA